MFNNTVNFQYFPPDDEITGPPRVTGSRIDPREQAFSTSSWFITGNTHTRILDEEDRQVMKDHLDMIMVELFQRPTPETVQEVSACFFPVEVADDPATGRLRVGHHSIAGGMRSSHASRRRRNQVRSVNARWVIEHGSRMKIDFHIVLEVVHLGRIMVDHIEIGEMIKRRMMRQNRNELTNFIATGGGGNHLKWNVEGLNKFGKPFRLYTSFANLGKLNMQAVQRYMTKQFRGERQTLVTETMKRTESSTPAFTDYAEVLTFRDVIEFTPHGPVRRKPTGVVFTEPRSNRRTRITGYGSDEEEEDRGPRPLAKRRPNRRVVPTEGEEWGGF